MSPSPECSTQPCPWGWPSRCPSPRSSPPDMESSARIGMKIPCSPPPVCSSQSRGFTDTAQLSCARLRFGSEPGCPGVCPCHPQIPILNPASTHGSPNRAHSPRWSHSQPCFAPGGGRDQTRASTAGSKSRSPGMLQPPGITGHSAVPPKTGPRLDGDLLPRCSRTSLSRRSDPQRDRTGTRTASPGFTPQPVTTKRRWLRSRRQEMDVTFREPLAPVPSPLVPAGCPPEPLQPGGTRDGEQTSLPGLLGKLGGWCPLPPPPCQARTKQDGEDTEEPRGGDGKDRKSVV